LNIRQCTGILVCLALLVLGFESAAADEADPKGPWTIVNYWSLWCEPCREEIPELNKLQEELQPAYAIVVGVNFDEDTPDKTLKIAKQMGIEFPVWTTAKVRELNLAPPFVLPTTYILSPDNEVKARLTGVQDRHSLKAKLAELTNSD
jgi:thiol-disulfide isomerase/thioredoxin